jgi:ABC-type multidrug transport system ATPase subunit
MLPDKLRLFDRLTGSQLLFYAGILYGLDDSVVTDRSKKLAHAFGLESALNRPVTDYSAGMQKKIALATAMIHAPRVLVLDEPFEAIDPVSAATLTELLEKFVQAGGSVILSSHSMEMIQRTCDHVAVIAEGKVIAQGTVDDVRAGKSLSERFESLMTDRARREQEFIEAAVTVSAAANVPEQRMESVTSEQLRQRTAAVVHAGMAQAATEADIADRTAAPTGEIRQAATASAATPRRRRSILDLDGVGESFADPDVPIGITVTGARVETDSKEAVA